MKRVIERSISGRGWYAADTEKTGNIVSDILCSRGICDDAEIRKFLNPSLKEQMPDPFVLAGMERAANTAVDAIFAKKRIMIFGDYDVDGITATAICVKFFAAIGADVRWRLPSRAEGYGLSPDAISEMKSDGAELIITVDCGISSIAEATLARELGMTLVITDHHMPDVIIPDADAVVNPKQPGDTSGLHYLAGVGVAFMFLVAVNRELKRREMPHMESHDMMNFLDLVAIGTICDTMPLVELNRAIAATGLRVLARTDNIGISALMNVAGAKSPSVYSVGFVIGPRLNAAGRMDTADDSLKLLLTDNPLIANDLAVRLDELNQDRKGVEDKTLMAAVQMAAGQPDAKCMFLCGDDWHGGIMGIVASRIKERYNVPTCVATRRNGIINGSGRSVAGIDLGAIIRAALDNGILTEGGGHAMAAGFSLHAENENKFREFLEISVVAQLDGACISNDIVADAEIDAGGADMKLVRELSAMAPFGQGNPEPTLIINGGTLAYASHMGTNHLRGNLRTSAGTSLAFVGFNMATTPVGKFLLDDANTGAKIMLAGKLKENEYNGRVTAQFVIDDAAI
ncbi:MAG: single-stranded-DNA-specific exonuclease RecJ [Rickettsiales bacterium]|nr:single-stranded-DNA-specific exonuclease RecJ [Rickettsiales bacterium]